MSAPLAGASVTDGRTTVAPMTDREFRLFRDLIERMGGIHLAPAKKALLVCRLSRRLRQLGLPSFGDYYELVASSEGTELAALLDAISTNETSFFREPHQFEIIGRDLVPSWISAAEAGRRPRRVRVWSAGCSTGEEPYSVAMLLLDRFAPTPGWSIDILATDLSTRALDSASRAIWPIAKSPQIPGRYLKRYMLQGTGSQEGVMSAGPELRSVITFLRWNLIETERYRELGGFDLILCRNVLIYFDTHVKQTIAWALLARLMPEGCLALGHAESLGALGIRARAIGASMFVLERAEGSR